MSLYICLFVFDQCAIQSLFPYDDDDDDDDDDMSLNNPIRFVCSIHTIYV